MIAAENAMIAAAKPVVSLSTHPITYDAAALHDGRTIDLPPVKLPRRGRPLTGEVKKTAAQIKREQRAKQNQRLVKVVESMRLLGEQQNDRLNQTSRLESELQIVLGKLNDSPDSEALMDEVVRIHDEIASIQSQWEYQTQEYRAKERFYPATPEGDMFLTDAPQGMGKLILGFDEDPDTGFQTIAGEKVAVFKEDDNHSRRVSPHSTDSLDEAPYKPDVVPFVNLRRWVFAKVVQRTPKELKALLKEYPLMSFFQPLCSQCDRRAEGIHPEDRHKRLSEATRFWCHAHKGVN